MAQPPGAHNPGKRARIVEMPLDFKHHSPGCVSGTLGRIFMNKYAIIISLLVLSSGCASIESTRIPGSSLENIETLYVQRLSPDQRGVEKIIADELTKMGLTSLYGDSDISPVPVDALVTYQDNWQWDITMYMLRLSIQIRDPNTKSLLAEAESYRPSLQRKSPNFMAREVLESIFGKDQQRSSASGQVQNAQQIDDGNSVKPSGDEPTP